ncbi:MAG: hypothetical protein Q8L21_02975 [Candidatus Komeilibacteria bacterium]|nr:hypothetical protein [Candidatus Komeilibacteria bacterium]
MFIIGELINGMYQNIAQAIAKRDKKAVQTCALENPAPTIILSLKFQAEP